MNLEDVIQRGTRVAQPAANTVAEGSLYFVTDELVIERSNGSAWQSFSGIGVPGNNQQLTRLPGIDGTDGIDGEMGAQGLLGPVGPTGPAGSVGSAAWNYIGTAVASGTAVDFINLSAYNEIMIQFIQVTVTSSGAIRQVRVSIDNGANFLASSGDYVSLDSAGSETPYTSITLHNTTASAARSGWTIISNFNTTYIKVANSGFPTTNLVCYMPSISAFNAIRLLPHQNSFNGGNFYIFGR